MAADEAPIGLFVTRRAREVSRAFDAALGAAGGSMADWLVLASLHGGLHQSQRAIADELGIEGATLTHHLNRMESAGLVTRTRNPQNRRAHDVAMTEAGAGVFGSLLGVVREFDARLRSGFDERDLGNLRVLLQRLADNAIRDDPEEET